MAGSREPVSPGLTDQRVAANVRSRREEIGLSQADLAARMAAIGWPYHPQTVSRVESGARKVSIGEGEALAGILGVTLGELTWPDPVTNVIAWFDMFTSAADEAYGQIARGVRDLLFARAQLERGVATADAHGLGEQEDVLQAVADARDRLRESTPDRAAEQGMRDYGQWFGDTAPYIEFDVDGGLVRPRAPWDEEEVPDGQGA